MQSDRIFRQAVQTVKASDLTAEDGTDDTVGIFDRQRDIDLFFAGDSGFADCQQLAAVQRFFQLVVFVRWCRLGWCPVLPPVYKAAALS